MKPTVAVTCVPSSYLAHPSLNSPDPAPCPAVCPPLSFLQAKPLDKLSPTRPHPTIFNPYFFISLLGQFA